MTLDRTILLSLKGCIILVLFLFSSEGFARTSQCDQFLNLELVKSTPLRQKYMDIANASKRLRSGKDSDTDTIDKAIIKDFIYKNLKIIDERIESQISQISDKRVLNILEKLNKVRQVFLSSEEYTLTEYRRLAFLYAQLMDFFPNSTVNNFLFNQIERYKANQHSPQKIVSIVVSDEFELSDWVKFGGLILIESSLYDPYTKIENPPVGVEFVPTFANLGFRTLLWGRSRGIEFIGQTSSVLKVDGREYIPSLFTLHDYSHANYRDRADISASTLFWDRVEIYLDRLNLNEREIKLIDALLFMMYHENSYPMSLQNGGNKPTYALEKVVTGEIGTVIARLNDKDDLGQAFESKVTLSEINSVFLILYKMFTEI